MTTNIKNFDIIEGVSLKAIKDTRFKTGRISFTMFLPLSKDTASRNSVMLYTLEKSCRKYNSFKSLNEKLNSLYGASLMVDVSKLGETQALNISLQGLSDKYAINNESISAEFSSLLCDLIFRPNIAEESFNENEVESAKLEVLDIISAEFSDKRVYARKRCNEFMCKDEAYSLSSIGEKENVIKLTGKDIYTAWRDALSRAKIEMIALGDFDFDAIVNNFTEEFKNIKRNYQDFEYVKVLSNSKKAEYKEENMGLAQAKLVLGYRVEERKTFKEKIAFRLMCAMLGGTPSSKLFLNVREKLSLCYYCSATFDSNKCVMFIESGVEDDNIQKTKIEISNQIDLMREGDFTEEDILANKLALQNVYMGISDSLGRLENFYISQCFQDTVRTPEEYSKALDNVTREEIIEAANSLTLNMIYVLTE